jgi:hypothetical protein
MSNVDAPTTRTLAVDSMAIGTPDTGDPRVAAGDVTCRVQKDGDFTTALRC